jgi:hypothetical protein
VGEGVVVFEKKNSYFFDLKNMISTCTKEFFFGGLKNGLNFARFCKKDEKSPARSVQQVPAGSQNMKGLLRNSSFTSGL